MFRNQFLYMNVITNAKLKYFSSQYIAPFTNFVVIMRVIRLMPSDNNPNKKH